MRIVFAGTPEPAVPSLRRLIASERHEVVAVVTRPDAMAGRGRKLARSPIGELADEHGIEVLTPPSASDPEFLARLAEFEPDACPVVAYGALLPRPILDVPKYGWMNLHFSLLPAWRGAAPVQAAINAGDEMTGATVFALDEGMDTGPVYGVVTETIRNTDTAGALLSRLAESGALLLESVLDGVEDGAVHAVPQPAEGVSHAPKVSVESARIRWDQPALAVHRHVRSVTPAPGAWTMIGDLRVKVGPVTLAQDTLPPGRIEIRKDGFYIGTSTTAVRLDQVQPQGKKQMAAVDWARGARLDGEVRAQ
ncbi:methionyl-tRNA formyltransferase [Rhodococcus sp. ABRD24]|uniref:methionyl-tRNA formyltransferase n=1 Tax=Rhodococcus sp. ABRD24 TaxID=2507582 RepID=UPI00103F954B|nr:methionyl-tRNA formyltransferase [Rhodococcus sp. ABRD24]QBJ98361.1 methionyl-tRNA formyltransferase [Rhodococcus sp. ABRD24]